MNLVCGNGHGATAGQRYCSICGSPVEQSCPSGHGNSLDDRYCRTCGVALGDWTANTGKGAPMVGHPGPGAGGAAAEGGMAVLADAWMVVDAPSDPAIPVGGAWGAPAGSPPVSPPTVAVPEVGSPAGSPPRRAQAGVPVGPPWLPPPGSGDPSPTPPEGTSQQAGVKPLLVAIMVVVLIIVVAGAAFAVVALRHRSQPTTSPPTTAAPSLEPGTAAPGSSPSTAVPSPTTTAPPAPAGGGAAAAQIASYVNQSTTVRPQVSTAISQVASCATTPAQGEAVLNQAIATRNQAVKGLGSLDPTGISNGTVIVQDLVQALNTSSTADQAYEAWMVDFNNQGSPCNTDPTTDTNYSAGNAASAQASTAKQMFVSVWNPVAPTYQLPTYQADSF